MNQSHSLCVQGERLHPAGERLRRLRGVPQQGRGGPQGGRLHRAPLRAPPPTHAGNHPGGQARQGTQRWAGV